jgi:dTDP-4-dehydrorhamnose reductase
MSRVLVTGIDGLLGQALAGQLCQKHELHGAGRNPQPDPRYTIARLDITRPEEVRSLFRLVKPEVIIDCAAMTNVDACEDQPDDARKVNAEAVTHLMAAAPDAKLVYISTDYIFDGTKGPYREDALPSPLGVYARTKLEGELLTLRDPRNLVVRTTILYGDKPGLHGKKDFVSYVVGELEQGRTVRAVTDQVGTPTHVRYLAQAIDHLLERDATGIYHAVGPDRASRAEFARAIAKAFGFGTDGIIEARTADLQQKAPRPLEAGLVTDKLAATGFRMPPLEQCLDAAWMSYRGIRVKECRKHATKDVNGRENGYVVPILSRLDDPGFVQDERFSHYYLTVAEPGSIKGWHTHRRKTGHFFVVDGLAKLVLHDGRRFKEFLLGREDGQEHDRVVRVPAGITAAIKAVGRKPALIINYSSPPYDPRDRDEMATTDIPYDWQ